MRTLWPSSALKWKYSLLKRRKTGSKGEAQKWQGLGLKNQILIRLRKKTRKCTQLSSKIKFLASTIHTCCTRSTTLTKRVQARTSTRRCRDSPLQKMRTRHHLPKRWCLKVCDINLEVIPPHLILNLRSSSSTPPRSSPSAQYVESLNQRDHYSRMRQTSLQRLSVERLSLNVRKIRSLPIANQKITTLLPLQGLSNKTPWLASMKRMSLSLRSNRGRSQRSPTRSLTLHHCRMTFT